MNWLLNWYEHLGFESVVWQLGMVVVSALFSYGVARPVLVPFLKRVKVKQNLGTFLRFLSPVMVFCVFMGCLLFCSILSWWKFGNASIVFLTLQLSLFFMVGRYVYLFSSSFFLSIFVMSFLCGVWALKKLPVLEPIRAYLASHSFTIGSYRITPDGVIKAIVTALFLFWITTFITSIGEKYIKKSRRLDSNTKELVTKIFDVGVYVLAAIIGLNIIGINLTTLNVIGGALGVGVGFGLQKITANFISGLILLLERSIKVGDLIELSPDAVGIVKQLGGRYVLVEASNGRDVLIPNEDLITQRVTNWTLTDNCGRIDIPVTIAYGSDVSLALRLMEEAAASHARTVKQPAPLCVVKHFTDSGIQILLIFFVTDVISGLMRPQSDVMCKVLEMFKQHNITIPFPHHTVELTKDSR